MFKMPHYPYVYLFLVLFDGVCLYDVVDLYYLKVFCNTKSANTLDKIDNYALLISPFVVLSLVVYSFVHNLTTA